MKPSNGHRFLLILGLAFAYTGCNSEADLGPTGTISGKLTYKGKPLQKGTTVVFEHAEGGYAGLGAADEEGNYSIDFYRQSGVTQEMPIGNYAVTVQPPEGSAVETVESEEGMSPDEFEATNRKLKLQKTEFPMKYRQKMTSDLREEVKEGENTINIDLE